mgnify:CR=1 FL=1
MVSQKLFLHQKIFLGQRRSYRELYAYEPFLYLLATQSLDFNKALLRILVHVCLDNTAEINLITN